MYISRSTHYLIVLLSLFLIAATSMGCVTSSSSQRPEPGEPDENGVYYITEEMPELIGGLESIQRRISYPKNHNNIGRQGRLFVQFVVDENGYTRDHKVIQSLGPEFDHAAVAAIMKARFKPGTRNGIPVSVKMSLPITFIY